VFVTCMHERVTTHSINSYPERHSMFSPAWLWMTSIQRQIPVHLLRSLQT
jgi:hypothetical protein